MKYRMENLDEFVAKSLALNVREVFATQKLTSKKVQIPGPPAPHPAAAPSPNMEVDYVTGYLLFTARGREKTGEGLDRETDELIFFMEEVQPSVVKNDAEAKALLDAIGKRKIEIMKVCADTFGSSPLGELMP
jgi:hypothetical protein